MVFSYESSYKHAMPMSKTDENLKNGSVPFLTKKPSPRCPVLLKTIGDYNLMTCMYLHYY